MKLTAIDTYDNDKAMRVTATVDFPLDTPLAVAINTVLDLFNGVSTPAQKAAVTADAIATAVAAAGTPRTRNRAKPAGAPATDTAPPADTTEPTPRRRARAAQADTGPAPITDVDLTTTSSWAAATIGPALVIEIMNAAPYEAKTVNDIKPEHRQQFIDELKEEVKLAEEEKALPPLFR